MRPVPAATSIDDRVVAGPTEGGKSERSPKTEPLSAERFRILSDQPLGSGGYGIVYKGFDELTGKHVAIKRAHYGEASLTKALEEEYALLTRLNHNRIVRVLHFSIPSANCCEIVMECMSSGSVSSLLKEAGFRLHENVIRRYAKDALEGLAFLYSQGVRHRDVKPGNMLIGANGELKLSDFGISKQSMGTGTNTGTHTVVGTAAFLAPESITLGKYSSASDMWAFGCTLVEMASGLPPWSELPIERRCPVPLMFHIGTAEPPNHHPTIPKHLSTPLQEIIKNCFTRDAKCRATAANLLEKEYFRDVEGNLPEDTETLLAYRTARMAEASVERRESVFQSFQATFCS